MSTTSTSPDPKRAKAQQPVDLEAIQLEEAVPPDAVALLERSQLEQDIALGNLLLELRKKYATRLFWVLVVWIVALFGVVALDGFSPWGFHLSENVVLTLLGATTVNIVGLFYVVARYVFPASPK